MSVIPLTLFFSLLLAGLFIALFAHEQRRRRFASTERDSLLPLADESARLVPVAPSQAAGHADHAACRCRQGAKAACAACLRQRDQRDPAHF